jgi:fatty-acyl-CoA synthase
MRVLSRYKEMFVVDELSLTAVGKPFKVPLRCVAARRELTDALAQVDGIRAVYAEMEDDALVVEIEYETASGNDAASAIASRYAIQYAITWRVVLRS